MADEFLRVGLRGEDGLAKAAQSDNNGILKTKVKGDAEQKDYMKDLVIPAGSYSDVPVTFEGGRIGVGVRLATAAKFSVNIIMKSADGAFTLSTTTKAIDYSAAASINGATTFSPMAANGLITIVNHEAVDITVRVMSVSSFK